VSSGGADAKSSIAARKNRKCPICDKPAEEKHLPFCSRRCAQVDLNRWLSGAYAIPSANQSGEDEGEDGDR
jgi:endogenous inhibitor of DNA gyrase (YacG/DUF329 family)